MARIELADTNLSASRGADVTKVPSSVPPAGPARGGCSRSDKLVLILFATPAFTFFGFVAVDLVSHLLDYQFFGGGDWGIVSWVISQFLACVILALALALSEGIGLGGLWTYTILGGAAGLAAFFLANDGSMGRGFWLPPLQFGLTGYLIGRIAYRGVNRPIPYSGSSTSIKNPSVDRKSGEDT